MDEYLWMMFWHLLAFKIGMLVSDYLRLTLTLSNNKLYRSYKCVELFQCWASCKKKENCGYMHAKFTAGYKTKSTKSRIGKNIYCAKLNTYCCVTLIQFPNIWIIVLLAWITYDIWIAFSVFQYPELTCIESIDSDTFVGVRSCLVL